MYPVTFPSHSLSLGFLLTDMATYFWWAGCSALEIMWNPGVAETDLAAPLNCMSLCCTISV